jgi:hypothetical protein
LQPGSVPMLPTRLTVCFPQLTGRERYAYASMQFSFVRRFLARDPWEITVWLLPFASVLVAPMSVGDLATELRLGQLMLDVHHVLRVDTLTYTIFGQPSVNQQWAAGLMFASIYGIAGWRGLLLLRAILVATAFGGTFHLTRKMGADPLVSAILVLVCLETAVIVPGTLSMRSQLLAVPLFLAALWVLKNRAERPSHLLLLIPIGIVWANVHGSFLLLTGLVGIAFTGDLVSRRYRAARWSGAFVIITLLTPLATPWGSGTYRYVAHLTSAPVVRQIGEWLPLWHQTVVWPAFLVVNVSLFLVVVWKRSRGPSFEESLALLVFTALAVSSARNVLWWALVVPPIIGGLLGRDGLEKEDLRRMSLMTTALFVVLIGFGMFRVITTQPPGALLSENASPGITNAVRSLAGSDSRIFAASWGGWFEVELPGVPMFVDSRSEIFPTHIWEEYHRVVTARPGFEEVLDEWGIDAVVLEREQHGVAIRTMEHTPPWVTYYQDSEGVVFVRP